jgi:hypothetical protein
MTSEGSYQWPVVYNMPVWLRNWVWEELKKRMEAIKENNGEEVLTEDNIKKQVKLHKPDVDYTVKRAPKK